MAETQARIEAIAAEEELHVLGWRDVPVVPELLGATARGGERLAKRDGWMLWRVAVPAGELSLYVAAQSWETAYGVS